MSFLQAFSVTSVSGVGVHTVGQPTARYEIDPDHSRAQFAVTHMMVSTVRGEFSGLTGVIQFDPTIIKQSTIEASFEAATVSTGVEKRDTHLRSRDFFHAAKFPKITFRSTEVRGAGVGRYRVTGDLTIRGVTKPVVMNVESAATEVKDPSGNFRRGAVARTRINRGNFGLNWNVSLEGGGVLVGESIEVTLDIQMVRKDAKTRPST
jgi:polyisoprenoid-binding protein YceI